MTFVVPGIVSFIVIAAVLQLYGMKTTLSSWNEGGRIIIASLLWLVGIMGWYFFVEKQLFFSRVLLVQGVTFMFLFVGLGRTAVIALQRSLLRSGIGVRLVVSIGSVRASQIARDTLEGDIRYSYLGHLNGLENIKRLHEKTHLDLVLQTEPNPDSEDTITLINYCRSHHIGYGFLPPVLADVPHQLVVEKLGLMPLIRFQPTPLDGWGRILKRLFDIVVSFILLIVLSPLLVIISFLVAIFDGIPVFYFSKRVGQRGRVTFRMLKFRTMVRDADKQKAELLKQNHRKDGPLFKMKNDPRVTRLGRVLRRWSLDELPQLFNVLRGRMSLVGPRPHLPEEVKLYEEDQRRVFAVKPGITGLAQVSGRSDLEFNEEVHLDLQYIEEWSPLLDLWILWRTVVVFFKGNGAD